MGGGEVPVYIGSSADKSTFPVYYFLSSFFFLSISVHVHIATFIGGVIRARHLLMRTAFCLVTQLRPVVKSSRSLQWTRCAQPVPDLSNTFACFFVFFFSPFFFLVSSQYSSLLDHLLISFFSLVPRLAPYNTEPATRYVHFIHFFPPFFAKYEVQHLDPFGDCCNVTVPGSNH